MEYATALWHFVSEHAKPIVEFSLPLAGEEGDDRVSPHDKLTAVPPDRILGVSESNAGRVSAVPCVLSESHFLDGRFQRERRDDERKRGHGEFP